MRALRVLPPITALVVGLLLARLGWHLLVDEEARIADGVLTLGAEDWFGIVVGSIWWTVAVLTGVAVLDGGPRALRRAVRALPVALAGVVAYLVPLIGCGFLAGLLLPGEPWVVVLVVTVTAIVLIGVATNLVLSATVAVVERAGFAAFSTYAELRGKRWETGVLFALGVVSPIVVLGLTHRYLHPASLPTGLAVELLVTLVAVGGAVLQSITLLEIYRRTRIIPELAPRSSAPPSRIALIAAGTAILLPTTMAAGVVEAAPLPEMWHTAKPMRSSVVALAWPPAHHPVLVTLDGIEDCLDDRCSESRRTELPTSSSAAKVGIRRDGTVIALSSGNDLTVCDPARFCSGGSQAGRVELLAGATATAVAVSPDSGEIVLAKATPSTTGADVDLALVRCQDEICRHGTTVPLGRVSGRPETGDTGEALSAGLDRSGRFFVVYRDQAGRGWLGWCEDPACTQTRLIEQGQPTENAPSTTDLIRSPRVPGVPFCSFASCHGLMPAVVAARPNGGFYAITTDPVGDSQLDVRLVRCDDPFCERFERVTTVLRDGRMPYSGDPLMFGVSDPARQDERWAITVGADGRVLMTKPRESPSVLIIVDPT